MRQGQQAQDKINESSLMGQMVADGRMVKNKNQKTQSHALTHL